MILSKKKYSILSVSTSTVKPVLRGHLGDKELKWSFKTGDLLKEVQLK